MKCLDLLTLLTPEEYGERWKKETYQKLASHIRTCAVCKQGVVRLSEVVIAEDVLSCDVCRARLPDYYEAMFPVDTSSQVTNVDIVKVALHLGRCVSCAEEYSVLVNLWEMEEQR